MKRIALMLVAVNMAYGGVALVRYADVDDSPGGMVIGSVIVLAAVALGARAVIRRAS